MTEKSKLLASIAHTMKDYRVDELCKPTPEHVERWVSQFNSDVQVPLLREIDYVLKRTYFSKSTVRNFFASQITHQPLAGPDPHVYWPGINILDIQKHGHSQADILALFREELMKQCGLDIEACGSKGGDFIYLDDVLFTGSRIGTDLEAWIADAAPLAATVHVLVIAAHRLGEWQCTNRLRNAADAAGKDLRFRIWAALRLENRRAYRRESEVLWPAVIPDNGMLVAYMAEEQRYPFEMRIPRAQSEHRIFSSEEGRQLLEAELLLAGIQIRSFCENPSRSMRPLGFSPFGLGFGSMIVTYRNCPNNTPLALWWGNPDSQMGHPLSKWYPLFPRKTYTNEINVDDIPI